MTFTDPITLLTLTLATFRLARIITTDQISAPLRELIWKRFPPNTQLGYLLTCNWCTSIWTASLVTIGCILIPTIFFPVCVVLALSALTGIISDFLDRT